MLTPLDETLSHQLPVTFDHVGSSDHQFFDRDWFSANHRGGEIALITGMATYNNTNTCDGFVAVQHDGRQYNLRVSRQLRPSTTEMRVGPLAREIIEPLWKMRLVLEPGDEYPVSCDLLWEGVLPAHEEPHYFSRTNGRAGTDYTRFAQAGKVGGWVQVGDERFDADDWWGCRDHSWGVRPGVGGWEVENGSDTDAMMAAMAAGGSLCWFDFATDKLGGHVQFTKDAQGRLRTTGFPLYGFVQRRDDFENRVAVVEADLDIETYPGTLAWQRAEIRMTTEDGAKWEVEAKPLHTAWAYAGTGYDRGWTDRRGLGAHRGAFALEHDVYDVSAPDKVLLVPDGTPVEGHHREQPASIVVNGERGNAHSMLMQLPTGAGGS